MPKSFLRSYRPLMGALPFLAALGCGNSSGPGKDLATHPAGTIAQTLTVTGRPHGVAIASNGRFCVSQIDAASLTCGMLTASAAILQSTTTVGATPAHVALAVDGSRAYTANQYGSSTSVVDLSAAAPSVLATIPLPSQGFNVLADPSGSRVYVSTSSGMLEVIDAGTRTIVAQAPAGAAANGLALDRAAGILYVSSISAGTITAISTATNTVMKTYSVSASPQRIALSPDGRTLYVASESAGLEILDLSSGARISVAGVDPQAVGLALSPDAKVVYVTNPPRGEVQIVDVATTQVTTLSGLGSPRNVAFGLSGAAALVTGETNTVYVIR
jgi:DNA-binding beta-propeller fold protein YncE